MAKRIQVGEAWAVRLGDRWYSTGIRAWDVRSARKLFLMRKAASIIAGEYGDARIVHIRFYEVQR